MSCGRGRYVAPPHHVDYATNGQRRIRQVPQDSSSRNVLGHGLEDQYVSNPGISLATVATDELPAYVPDRFLFPGGHDVVRDASTPAHSRTVGLVAGGCPEHGAHHLAVARGRGAGTRRVERRDRAGVPFRRRHGRPGGLGPPNRPVTFPADGQRQGWSVRDLQPGRHAGAAAGLRHPVLGQRGRAPRGEHRWSDPGPRRRLPAGRSVLHSRPDHPAVVVDDRGCRPYRSQR